MKCHGWLTLDQDTTFQHQNEILEKDFSRGEHSTFPNLNYFQFFEKTLFSVEKTSKKISFNALSSAKVLFFAQIQIFKFFSKQP